MPDSPYEHEPNSAQDIYIYPEFDADFIEASAAVLGKFSEVELAHTERAADQCVDQILAALVSHQGLARAIGVRAETEVMIRQAAALSKGDASVKRLFAATLGGKDFLYGVYRFNTPEQQTAGSPEFRMSYEFDVQSSRINNIKIYSNETDPPQSALFFLARKDKPIRGEIARLFHKDDNRSTERIGYMPDGVGFMLDLTQTTTQPEGTFLYRSSFNFNNLIDVTLNDETYTVYGSNASVDPTFHSLN